MHLSSALNGGSWIVAILVVASRTKTIGSRNSWTCAQRCISLTMVYFYCFCMHGRHNSLLRIELRDILVYSVMLCGTPWQIGMSRMIMHLHSGEGWILDHEDWRLVLLNWAMLLHFFIPICNGVLLENHGSCYKAVVVRRVFTVTAYTWCT